MSTSTRTTTSTMCPMNCHPTFCGMQVTIEDGKVVEVKGDKANPDSRGFLCQRGQATKQIVGNPDRLRYPMLRDRRDGEWRRASWDEALDRIAGSIDEVGRQATGMWMGHGVLANDYGTFAHVQLALRLANMAGLQSWDGSMICWGLGGFGLGLTGVMQVNTKEDMGANADFILLWGSNLSSQPNTTRYISAAKRRGAAILAVDVRVSEACRHADEYLLIKPGTDAALALAMMHVIISEDLHDAKFIAEHTIGFDKLVEHVQTCTPEWAAPITGIAVARIVELARCYAGTERAMILLGGSSLYKSTNGWQSSRAVSCLPALTGKLGKPGTGLGPRHAGDCHGFGLQFIVNVEARPPADYIPAQMSAILDAIEDGRIRTMLLLGTNMLSSFADAGRLARGFEQMALIVGYDLFMTETARRFADIVLPATSWLEDVGCKATNTHLYLMDRLLEPEGESWPMHKVLRALAARLGVDAFYPWEGETGHIDAVLAHPATGHATVASLRASGRIRELEISHVAHIDHRFTTPSGKVEFWSDGAGDCGLPGLPDYTARNGDANYPLELRSGRTLARFHSFYDHGRALPAMAKVESEPVLWIAEEDAAVRGVRQGDAIRMFNQRGECRAIAEVTDKIPSGTVWMRDGQPGLNTLTAGGASIPDAATLLFPFSSGQSAYDAFVEVENRN